MKRILFKGKPALSGRCGFCYRILIITDPDPDDNGSFESHHAAPQCEEYKRRCQNAESLGVTDVYEDEVSDGH